jgi:ribosomal protein S27AE
MEEMKMDEMRRVCPKCGGALQIQAVSEIKKRGCLSILFYIVLLCIPIIGWIALFCLLRGRKSKTVSYRVCQNCGYREKV